MHVIENKGTGDELVVNYILALFSVQSVFSRRGAESSGVQNGFNLLNFFCSLSDFFRQKHN